MIFYDVKEKTIEMNWSIQSVNGIIYNPRTIQLNQI